MGATNQNVDWLAVEADFRSGAGTLRELSAKHGCSEGLIRQRAKKNGWLRDPSSLKAERVRSVLALAESDATQDPSQNASDKIDAEVNRDVAFSTRATAVFEQVLFKVSEIIFHQGEPRQLKILTETASMAVASYRKLRGLEVMSTGGTLESCLDSLAQS
jgi:hypothetical protein